MSTARQKAANQANAQKSTGPRTPQGKATSSLNAISYGFGAATHFLKGEDPEEFYALQADLVREFHPATPFEQILVEKMVHNHWLSLRAIRLQSERLVTRDPWNEIPKDLGLLIRYQTAADRAFHKAHAEFLKARKQRENQEIGFVSQNAVDPSQPLCDGLQAVELPTERQAFATAPSVLRENTLIEPLRC